MASLVVRSIRRWWKTAFVEDITHDIKAILVVQIDTASGVVNDIPAIRAAIDSLRAIPPC